MKNKIKNFTESNELRIGISEKDDEYGLPQTLCLSCIEGTFSFSFHMKKEQAIELYSALNKTIETMGE